VLADRDLPEAAIRQCTLGSQASRVSGGTRSM
jgi:hypothetical protein